MEGRRRSTVEPESSKVLMSFLLRCNNTGRYRWEKKAGANGNSARGSATESKRGHRMHFKVREGRVGRRKNIEGQGVEARHATG